MAGWHWADFDETKRCDSQRKQPPAGAGAYAEGPMLSSPFAALRFVSSKPVQYEPALTTTCWQSLDASDDETSWP